MGPAPHEASWILEGAVCVPGTVCGPRRLRITAAGTTIEPTEAPVTGGDPRLRFRCGDRVWIVPGFVDGHTHLLAEGLAAFKPDLSGSRSLAEALERTSAWLDAHPGDRPVVAEGWDQSAWGDPAFPTRTQLDRIAPKRPVALRRVCGHVAVLNSAALADLGDRATDLDAATGLALESVPLSLNRLWPPSAEEYAVGVRAAQERAWERGITAVQEMGTPAGLRAFGGAAVQGRLGLRIHHFLGLEPLDAVLASGWPAGLGDGRLRYAGLKLFLDGSIGGRTAAVRDPYPGPQGGGRGRLLHTDAEVRSILRRAFEGGLPVVIHAIGDAAVAQAVEAVEQLAAEGVRAPEPGPRIEHAEMLPEDLFERAVAAGFRFSMQPNFTARWQHAGGLYEAALGASRALALNPYRRCAESGRLLFGSDCMPLDPLLGLAGAVGHPDSGQRLTLAEAVRAYSRDAAGSVVAPFGSWDGDSGPSDFTVLRLPRVIGPEDWRRRGDRGLLDGAEVLMTIVDGEPRWRSPSFATAVEIAGPDSAAS